MNASKARIAKGALAGVALVAMIFVGRAWGTPSTAQSTLLGRATYDDPINVRRLGEDNWKVDVKAKPALDVAVQSIVFQPGAQSGWHSHPGPVFISVVSGTMTFYEGDDPDCEPVVRHAGEGFLDVGDHAHLARNETSEPATNIVTYFAPPGAALRIDQPAPGNCPF
jgi:quercetin dioxygenase-like cupin family protein